MQSFFTRVSSLPPIYLCSIVESLFVASTTFWEVESPMQKITLFEYGRSFPSVHTARASLFVVDVGPYTARRV